MKWFLHILVITFVLLAVCEARGGGGRRGGSMGGLFGSWRKYKKPATSGGSSRRIVSSSPVHTPITKALNEKKGDKFVKNSKTYNKYNTPPLPAGGSYYTNTAAMPGNAIYVAQAPPRGAEFGDFLTGYLTGRLMTMGMSPYPYHQVTHIYRDNPQPSNPQTNNDNSGKVIIINNGADAMTNSTPSTTTASSTINTSTTETGSSSSPYALAYTSSTSTTASASVSANTPTDTPTPANGIICIPLKVNETNASGDVIQVDRIVCYPAPPPPAPIENEMKSKPVEIAGDIITH